MPVNTGMFSLSFSLSKSSSVLQLLQFLVLTNINKLITALYKVHPKKHSKNSEGGVGEGCTRGSRAKISRIMLQDKALGGINETIVLVGLECRYSQYDYRYIITYCCKHVGH